jgi:hypothetical protein
MTTYQTAWSTIDISTDDPVDIGQLAYSRQRFRNEMHQAVLKTFIDLVDNHGFTQSRLAKKLGKKPSQVSRWLAAPGNWTIDSISDFLLAMNSEPESSIRCLDNLPRQNFAHDLSLVEAAKPSTERNVDVRIYPVDDNPRAPSRSAAVKIHVINL